MALSAEELLSRLGRFETLFDHGTLEEQRMFVRQMLNRVELDPTAKAYWYRQEDVAVPPPETHLSG